MRTAQISSSIFTGWVDRAVAFSCVQGIRWIRTERLMVPHIPGDVKHFRIYPYPASCRYQRR